MQLVMAFSLYSGNGKEDNTQLLEVLKTPLLVNKKF